ncbi:MICOS complex subunit MIC13 homolog QIL1 [Drosophila novamexicana]|uniref:MICOS complex subunit MIC13 homolog QIL1 n=1 Tax=Drosophila novamexicana TaxID=47314 RepID=UPI0011E5D135|nr:MICOS complex subunit MIC13 homolog QIL1 [Drosophila novamexicana]
MVVGLLVRCGVVAGAVYYTRQAGVWGSTDETDKLYKNVKTQLTPYVQQAREQLPFDVPELPRVGEMRFLAKHYYNEGVKSSFRFIHMLPCYAGRGLKKVKDTIEEFAKAPAISASSEKPATETANK